MDNGPISFFLNYIEYTEWYIFIMLSKVLRDFKFLWIFGFPIEYMVLDLKYQVWSTIDLYKIYLLGVLLIPIG